MSREELKGLFLKHSENSADRYVRGGRISADAHCLIVETLRASRLEWEKAVERVNNQVALGFVSRDEADLILSVAAEYCPSKFD